MNTWLVAGGSSTGGTVDGNREEEHWTKKNCVDLPRLPSPHGNRASSGVGGGPLPPRLTQRQTNTTEDEQSTILKEHTIMFLLFLFQNPSEVSDEELNDDLLQSDDEDINMRYISDRCSFFFNVVSW